MKNMFFTMIRRIDFATRMSLGLRMLAAIRAVGLCQRLEIRAQTAKTPLESGADTPAEAVGKTNNLAVLVFSQLRRFVKRKTVFR